METNSREAVPPDPLITVEPAPSGQRGADWTHARDAVPVPVAVPVECPHRITVWDLKGANQIVLAVAALLVFASGLSVIAPLAVFAIAVFMMTHGAPAWVLLIGVPPVAVMVVLGYSRAVLYHPGTCGSHPWLPVKIQQLVRA